MYTVFLAGGIASGKSSVALRMERRGAWRCDLDSISRDVLSPGGEVALAVAREFGDDLLDPETGELDRASLASRAFSSAADVARLEAIELPAIKAELARVLTSSCCAAAQPAVCVVEVPLLDRMVDMLPLADEVVVVTCPVDVRRARAVSRGMDAADFDARAANQPTDAFLVAHADTVIANEGDAASLAGRVDEWWDSRSATGWAGPRRGRGHA